MLTESKKPRHLVIVSASPVSNGTLVALRLAAKWSATGVPLRGNGILRCMRFWRKWPEIGPKTLHISAQNAVTFNAATT